MITSLAEALNYSIDELSYSMKKKVKSYHKNKEFYKKSKIDNEIYCKKNGEFSRHLKQHSLTYQEYHEIYITKHSPLCSCLKPLVLNQKNDTYNRACNNRKCVGLITSQVKSNFTKEKNKTINDKRMSTVSKKYGVRNITQYSSFKEKVKNTRSKIMNDGRTKEEHIQEACQLGKLKKYGDRYYSNPKKAKDTKSKMSVEQKQLIVDKRRKTNLERYGVESTLLLPGNNTKSNKGNRKIKNYIFPSGKCEKVRGYEPLVLDILLQTYDEEDIFVNYLDIPILSYKAVNRHKYKYYPDIYIPKENKLIEVKSRWWYDGNGGEKYKSRLKNNQRKMMSAINSGYSYELWIFEVDKTITIIKG